MNNILTVVVADANTGNSTVFNVKIFSLCGCARFDSKFVKLLLHDRNEHGAKCSAVVRRMLRAVNYAAEISTHVYQPIGCRTGKVSEVAQRGVIRTFAFKFEVVVVSGVRFLQGHLDLAAAGIKCCGRQSCGAADHRKLFDQDNV